MFADIFMTLKSGTPDNGVGPKTRFEDLPADWTCPDCGAAKEEFDPMN